MTPAKRLPRIVIMGRPNVGKSTLFNRLFGRRRALVHDLPGVTRDRLEEQAEWWVRAKRLPVLLVDTGGVGGDMFGAEVDRQVGIAVESADVVVVLFDGQSGLTPADREAVRRLKQSGLLGRGETARAVIGVVNKVDAETHEDRINEFYALGLDPLLTISAEHGRGIDTFQETIWDLLPEELRTPDEGAPVAEEPYGDEPEPAEEASLESSDDENLEDDADQDSTEDSDGTDTETETETETDTDAGHARRVPRVALVGRPNVGKSTLTNALLREDRMITSPVAGTTIDSVDSAVMLDGREFVLIDTAGIRRKSKTEQGVEVLSVVQTRKALERCDIAILLLDAETGTTDQDEKIAGLIEEVGCGVILAVNKWDIRNNRETRFTKKEVTREDAADEVRRKFAFMKYAPLMFISAKQGRGFEGLPDLIDEILEQRRVKVSTREFTEWVRKESEIHNPMNARFYMAHQSGRHPPTFVCHVSDPKKVHFSLKRHLVNALRERWGYMGNPVRLLFVQGGGRPAKRPTVR